MRIEVHDLPERKMERGELVSSKQVSYFLSLCGWDRHTEDASSHQDQVGTVRTDDGFLWMQHLEQRY